MGFSPKVRATVLTRAARYCCVCHERAGLKVEVHHIIPESISHDNSIDNAIALCFDCHTDAGHYNPAHPKGTKFSTDELTRHRNNWYSIVENNKIPNITTKDYVHVRYHLPMHYDIFSKIQQAVFPRIWGENILYFAGPIGLAHKQYHTKNNKDFRRRDMCKSHYATEADYLAAEEEARLLTDEERMSLPLYSTARNLKKEDFDLVKVKDPLIEKFIENNLSEKFFLPLGHFCGCSGLFLDELISRPIWPVFIGLANSSSAPLTIERVLGEFAENEIFEATRIGSERRYPYEILLSEMKLRAGESIILPIMTLFGPISGDLGDSVISSREMVDQGTHDTLERLDITESSKNCLLIGPSFWPQRISGIQNGEQYSQDIHPCDFSRFFTVDRDFMCGSCPHIFEVKSDGTTEYLREIIASGRDVFQIEFLVASEHAVGFEVAELEDEITAIKAVNVDGQQQCSNFVLRRGESIRISARPGQRLEITGKYTLNSDQEKADSNSVVLNDMIRRWKKT